MTKHPRKKGSITILFLVTDAERQYLDDEVADLCNGHVGYQTIYEMAPFLKRKWESLLMKDLQLYPVLEYVIHSHIGKIEWIAGMDEVPKRERSASAAPGGVLSRSFQQSV